MKWSENFGKKSARLRGLVAEQQLDIRILNLVAKGDFETDAAMPSDQAADEGDGSVWAACLPDCRLAPEHAAPADATYPVS